MNSEYFTPDIIFIVQSFLFEDSWYASTQVSRSWRLASHKDPERWNEYNEFLIHRKETLLIRYRHGIEYWDNIKEYTPGHIFLCGPSRIKRTSALGDIIGNRLKDADVILHSFR
jgi:hypothetical protein